MKNKLLICAITAQMAAFSPGLASACSVAHVLYTLDGAPYIKARFEPLGSHGHTLGEEAFVIESDKSGKKISYLFDMGSGPGVHLISTEDVTQPNWTPPDPDSRKHRPLFDTEYLEATASDHFNAPREPHATDDAAAKILVNDLSEALKLGGLTDQYVLQGFFRISSCSTL